VRDDIDLDAGTVLAVLAEQAGARAALDAAGVAAAALRRPTVAGLHVRVDPFSEILPTEEILLPAQAQEMERDAAAEGEALQQVFSAFAAGLDAAIATRWLDIAGGIDETITALGGEAALTVMARLTPASRGHARAALHACLFRTGRPVLVVPHGYAPRRPARILVGWTDTPPGRRTLEAALPWLRQAQKVRLVCIGQPGPAELAWARDRLGAAGIAAEIAGIARREALSVGAQLIAAATAFQADWLVTGAYWHNEYAEWVLGGVTDTLLRQATLPLFMHH